MNNTHEYILRDGRFFRRQFREVDLGAQDDMLKSLADNLAVTCVNVFKLKREIPATTLHPAARMHEHYFDMSIAGNYIMFSTRVPFVPIYCGFREKEFELDNGDNFVVDEIDFHSETVKRMEWAFDEVDNWLTFVFDRKNLSCCGVYLTCVHKYDHEGVYRFVYFTPDIMNVASDASFCLGENIWDELEHWVEDQGEPTLQARIAWLFKYYYNTRNNSDLGYNQGILRFHENKSSFVPTSSYITSDTLQGKTWRREKFRTMPSVTRSYLVSNFESLLQPEYYHHYSL